MQTKNCQLCDSEKLKKVIDLGYHPLADTFLSAEALQEPESIYPLRVLLCESCGYVTLEYIVDAPTRYQKIDYSYTSSNSAVAVRHFQEIAKEAIDELHISDKDIVVDVGSNDGTLLKAFREQSGCQIFGVEPAPNIVRIAEKNNVPTIQDFFNKKTVKKIKKHGRAKAITANNVFNHITDIDDFVKNIADLLTDNGAFIFEVPYLLDLIEMNAFDTIYLEHVSYFGIKPLVRFFRKFGLHIFRIERIEYMGGSVRVYVSKQNKNSSPATKLIKIENAAKIYNFITFDTLMKKIHDFKFNLCQRVYDIKARGEKIIAIGAAAKGNTLLNYCRLDNTLIEFITDSSPFKIGKFAPGSHIPIKTDADITSDIKYGFILPWNIGEFLKEKLKYLNLQFIIPKMKK